MKTPDNYVKDIQYIKLRHRNKLERLFKIPKLIILHYNLMRSHPKHLRFGRIKAFKLALRLSLNIIK